MWSVIEQPHFVACGKADFEDEVLKFYDTITQAASERKIRCSLVLWRLAMPAKALRFFGHLRRYGGTAHSDRSASRNRCRGGSHRNSSTSANRFTRRTPRTGPVQRHGSGNLMGRTSRIFVFAILTDARSVRSLLDLLQASERLSLAGRPRRLAVNISSSPRRECWRQQRASSALRRIQGEPADVR
jgi:hypothetical protein